MSTSTPLQTCLFTLTPSERTQLLHSPFARLSKRPFDGFARLIEPYNLPPGRPCFKPKTEKWDGRHLEELRIVPLDDLVVDRIVPEKFLPALDDPVLLRMHEMIDCKPVKSKPHPFRPLFAALDQARAKHWETARHSGESILSGFFEAFDHEEKHMLEKDRRLGHVLSSVEDIPFSLNDGTWGTKFSAQTHGHVFLDGPASSEIDNVPVVSQAVYTGNNLGVQVGILLACFERQARFCDGLISQECFQLSLESFSKLRFNYIHIPQSWGYCTMLDELLINSPFLEPIPLRRSIVYDLATPDGLKGAVRAMLGWRRYLMSGQALVEQLQLSYDAAVREKSRLRKEKRKAEAEEKRKVGEKREPIVVEE